MADTVFELLAKLSIDSDDFDSGLDAAKNKLSGVGSVIGGVAATGAAAVGAAATAVADLTNQAVSAYGQTQQLIGGVETLFGESAEKVLTDAENAFNDAGMSMNQYMETSIQSAAALINSLDGDQARAAELMNMSIVDMADNVNKMGTTMEAVQNAYRGFSRGNFTMLDNLALGFAGTKDGMQELLDMAEQISGVEFDIESYSDIVQAINIVQTNMGISGTTADEAAKTITGSSAAVGAAWQNLVAGLADPSADIGKLIQQVVDTGSTALKNLLPTIRQAITGVGQFVKQVAPYLATELPGMIKEFMPGLIEAALSMVDGISEVMPEIISNLTTLILTYAPEIIEAGFKIMVALGQGLIQAIPTVIPQVIAYLKTAISNIFSFLSETDLTGGLLEKLGSFGTAIQTIVDTVMEIAPVIMNTLIDTFNAISSAVGVAIDTFLSFVENSGFLETAADLLSIALEVLAGWFTGIADGIANFVTWLTSGSATAQLFEAAVIAITTAIIAYNAYLAASTIATNALALAQGAWKVVTEGVTIAQTALNVVLNANPIGVLIIAITALVAAFTWLWNTSDDFRNGWIEIWTSIKDFFAGVVEGIGAFFTETLPEYFNGALDFLASLPDMALTWGADLIQSFVDGILSGITWVEDAVTEVADSVKSFLGFSEPDEGPLSNFHTFAPDMIDLWTQGIDENLDKIEGASIDFASAMIPQAVTPALAGGGTGDSMLGGGDIIIPVYIGDDRIDEILVNAEQIRNYRSGGV